LRGITIRVVIKLGGSLMKHSNAIVNTLLLSLQESENKHSILIVPGGGDFANAIRSIDKKYALSNDATHWMAILSMEQYAYYIADKSNVTSVDSLDNINPGLSLLFPYNILKRTDELEHSWNITSDSIAAWIAKKTDATLIKLTDVDGVFNNEVLQRQMTADELESMGRTCIDSSLATFLKNNKMDCIVINGKEPERIVDAVIGKDAIGTYIKGNI